MDKLGAFASKLLHFLKCSPGKVSGRNGIDLADDKSLCAEELLLGISPYLGRTREAEEDNITFSSWFSGGFSMVFWGGFYGFLLFFLRFSMVFLWFF